MPVLFSATACPRATQLGLHNIIVVMLARAAGLATECPGSNLDCACGDGALVRALLSNRQGEGAPNQSMILLVLAVFIGIEGAGVLLGYLLFRQFLGIIRS